MAYLSVADEARIWSSLDDELRAKIRSGELTFEEAERFVVPIGDIELQQMREEYPTRSGITGDALDQEAPSTEGYGLQTMWDKGVGQLDAFVQTQQQYINDAGVQQAERIESARETGLGSTIMGSYTRRREEALAAKKAESVKMGFEMPDSGIGKLMDMGIDLVSAAAEGVQTEIQAGFMSSDTVARKAEEEMAAFAQNQQELDRIAAYLSTLPANPYASAFIEKVNEGDYLAAAWAAPLAAATTMGEQAPTLLAQTGLSAATFAVTRNLATTLRVATASGAASGFSEWGSDYISVLESMTPEERMDITKVREALETSKNAALARAVIEGMVPGRLQALGKTGVQRAALNALGQSTSGIAGEAVAAGIMGQERSAGELALEGLADMAGVVTEAYPSLKRAAEQDAQDVRAAAYVEQEKNRAFNQSLAELQQDKVANANRAQFDAELEADRAIQDFKDGEALAQGNQLELPIGSGEGGNVRPANYDGTPTPGYGDMLNPGRAVPGTDREPTVVDMFSGEETPSAPVATTQERQRSGYVPPEETDESFEIRSQRVADAKRGIEGRKAVEQTEQDLFDEEQRDLLNRRTEAADILAEEDTEEGIRRKAEDQTILKNEKSSLSTADITREAKTLLAKELEGVRRAKKGIASTPERMDAILKAYERKRLPELIDNVRKRRTDLVTQARAREIARENATIKADNEKLAAEQAQKKFTTGNTRTDADRARSAETPLIGAKEGRNALTDLLPGNMLKKAQTYTAKKDVKEREQQDEFELYSQQYSESLPPRGTQGDLGTLPQATDGDLFGTSTSGFRGTLTEKQAAAELARRQKQRRDEGGSRKEAEEKATTESKKKQEEAAKSVAPTVEKAIAQEQTRRANLTVKTYDKKKSKALAEIVQEELDKPGRTPEEIKAATTARVLEWEKQNPAPEAPPAPKPDLVEQAKKVAKAGETAKKSAETRTTNKTLKRLIENGATPEEAAEIVANERMDKNEEADLRQELGGKKGKPADRSNLTLVERSDGGVEYLENEALRSTLDAELAKARPSLGNLLRAIATNPDSGAFKAERWLASRLAGLIDNLGITLAPMTDDPAFLNDAGVFFPTLNEVQIRAADAETILHEALHAVTSNLIDSTIAKANPVVRAAVAKLQAAMDAAKAYVEANPDALEGRAKQRWGAATKNLKEFLAHGMTEGEFQDFFSGIPMPGKKKSIWQGFKDAVVSFFTPRNDDQMNVLDAIIEATGELVEFSEQNPEANAWATAERKQKANRLSLKPQGERRTLDSVDDVEEEVEFSNPVKREQFTNIGPQWGRISIRPEWKNKKTLAGAIVDMFSAGAGGLKVSTEIFDRAQSETAEQIFRAEQHYRNIDSSLENQAPQTKEGIAEYRKEFIEKVTEFEKETGRVTKAKLARALRDKYGPAARSYFTMRRTIDKLSKDILQQRLDDPRPFTNAEAKIYRSIRDNIGGYYTRVYAANTKGLGETRAREIEKAYNAVAEGSTEEQHQEGYRTVRNAATFIRDNVLAIPDRDTLESMPLVRLQKLANAWGIEPTTGADLDNPMMGELRRAALVDALMEFADSSPQAKDSKALELVLEALNRNDSTLMNYFRGAKQDRTIVTEREAVPKEIRKLLGEFEDVPLRAMITIARQAEFRARNAAFNELLTAERGNRILSPAEFTAAGLNPKEWPLLKGEAYGALNGMRVRKDLAGRVEDSAEVTRTFEQVWNMAESRPLEVIKKTLGKAVTGWARVAAGVKAVQLVWNVGNAAFNFLGGPLIMLSNGNLDYANTKRALGVAWDLINSARANSPVTKDMATVVRAGITDSAFMGEIRAVELEQLRLLTLEGFASEAGRKAGKFRQGVRGTKRMWREAYAMADVTWKIANFFSEQEKLTKFYAAEGVTKTDMQIEREAAWRTNLSNFSYKRVPNLLKVVEKGGLTYVMPYIYETMRSPVGSIFVGVHDLKLAGAATTPEGKAIMQKAGFKRIAGSLLALGTAQQMAVMTVKAAAEALGESDDELEEWIEDLKAMLPDYKRFSDYVYMGRTEGGKPVLFELSRLDPFGPVTEFYRMALSGAEPDQMLEALGGMWINNPYGSSLLSAFFGDPSMGTRMERIQPSAASALTNTLASALDFVPYVSIDEADAGARRMVKAVDSLFPSMPLNMLDPNNESADGDVAGWIMTNLMGVKVHQIDPAVTTQYQGMEFRTSQDSIRDAFYNYLKNTTGMSDNDVLSRYTALQSEEAANFENIERHYNGLLRLGYSEAQAVNMLKTGGLSENDLLIIYNGGYRPEYSGIVNYANLEQSLKKTVQIPNISDDKKRLYIDNITRVVSLAEQGQLPARRE